MTEVEIDFRKSAQENMQKYFDEAKWARQKKEATEKAMEETKKKIKETEIKSQEENKKKELKKREKKEWYEKFKWFYTSSGKLVIAGKDATSNEIIVKKHMEKEDIVFHTEAPGSPFCIIKNADPENLEDIKETAQFCVSHSKAWTRGLGSVDAYWIFPEQVSKQAPAGEYIGKGAFMISGKKNILKSVLELAIGIYGSKVSCAPASAVKAHSKICILIKPGQEKKSDTAKKIRGILKKNGFEIELDEIMQAMPPGDCKIEKLK